MGQTHFFATRADLLPLFLAVEGRRGLKYVPTMNSLTPEYPVFRSGADLPNLGTAPYESAVCGPSYLVTETATPIRVRVLHPTPKASRDSSDQYLGFLSEDEPTGPPVRRYLLDQMENPDTVVFSPGGLWGNDCLLSGAFGTCTDSPLSASLLKSFRGPIRKQFTHVGNYWVGPQALTLLRGGKRLTAAEQCPREYDLSEG